MNIKLLKIRPEHLEKIRLWRMSQEVTKYMFTDPIISSENQNEWFKKVIQQDLLRMDWVINVNGADIGVVWLYDINPIHKRCYWGCYIAEEDFRMSGVGGIVELNVLKYVFDELLLNKLCCEVFEWNSLAIKTHKRCGFKVEGICREHVWKRGQFHNIFIMAILRKEWYQEVKNKYCTFLIADIEEWKEKVLYLMTLTLN